MADPRSCCYVRVLHLIVAVVIVVVVVTAVGFWLATLFSLY